MSFISERQSIEKNFDEFQKDLDKLKEITVQKYETLESTTKFKKIQSFKPLWLESVNIRLIENNSWYGLNKIKHIKMDMPKECFEYLFNNYKDACDFPEHNKNSYYFKININENNTEQLHLAKNIINVIYERDIKIHNENLNILKNNKILWSKIFNLLKQVGIRDKYYGFKSNRHKKQDWINYNWPYEISRQIPTNYSENRCEELKDKIIKQLNELYNKEVKRIKDEKLKKEKEQQEKQKNKQLALLLAKYDLELTDDWEELLHRIMRKNKYLWLAYHLEENRNDWSNGYDDAEFGLSLFKVESELDEKINNEIQGLIDDWQGDGRVFRDCEYNYSVLYGMVAEQDNELYKDFEVVKKYIND